MKTLANIIINDRPVSDVYWVAEEFSGDELKIFADNPACEIMLIRGSSIHTQQEFLDSMQMTMDSPEHCNYSWDTLLDCMRGIRHPLSPINMYIFVYDAIEVFAISNKADFQTALHVMKHATGAWRDRSPERRMYVFLWGDKNVVPSIPTLGI